MTINAKLKIILVILTAIIIGMFLDTYTSIRQQENDGLLINIAGRQRMLTQKMTKELYSHLLIVEKTAQADADLVERVRHTEKVFDMTLDALINSGKAPVGIGQDNTKYHEISAADGDAAVQLARVERSWRQFRSVMDNILSGKYSVKDLIWIAENNMNLLKEMNKAVQIMQADSEKAFRTLLFVQIILVVLGIICSLAAGLFVHNFLIRLTRVMVFADKFGEGNLTVTAEVSGNDELGSIGKSLNKMAANLCRIISGVGENAVQLGQDSEQLLGFSAQVSSDSDMVSELSRSVAVSASQMSGNMSSVAAATEESATNVSIITSSVGEMNTSIGKITGDTENARVITENAVQQSERASELVNELGDAATKIGKVTETITEISEQTNLLALNATIEAARAGEAGKGFAVVANEIKELARQTAEATMDIRNSIESIQSSTSVTVVEISGISSIIKEANEIVTNIAVSLEEQAATTSEISENVSQASIAIQEVTENVAQSSMAASEVAGDINKVSDQSGTIKSSSHGLAKTAEHLDSLAGELATIVKKFTV